MLTSEQAIAALNEALASDELKRDPEQYAKLVRLKQDLGKLPPGARPGPEAGRLLKAFLSSMLDRELKEQRALLAQARATRDAKAQEAYESVIKALLEAQHGVEALGTAGPGAVEAVGAKIANATSTAEQAVDRAAGASALAGGRAR